jgi:hypothetical protein
MKWGYHWFSRESVLWRYLLLYCKVIFIAVCRTGKDQLTHEDLALLCDLFYLPFEHGGQGLQLLHEFNWLKSNAQLVTHANCMKKTTTADQEAPTKPEVIRHALHIEVITVQCRSLYHIHLLLPIYLILPATLGPEVYSASNRMSTRSRKIMFLGSKARPVRRADNLTAILTSLNPIGLHVLLQG